MKRLYNRKILFIAISLLIITIGIKIHSAITFPQITDWNYRQLQKIDKKAKNFSFAVFGDNKNSITTFKNLINAVNSDKVMFAIDIGDLIQDGEKEKYRFFINQIKEFKKPLLTAIGNHELRENGRGNYYDLFGRFYYSFTVGDAYFIILDDANEYNLDPWQMEWVKEQLEKALKYKYRFVFMHVPLFDPRKEGPRIAHNLKDIRFANQLNSIFDNYNITMLFASHIHSFYRGMWNKTPYIITGGAGAELVGANPEHDFYHYIKVNVNDAGVRYEVKKIKSPDFEAIDRLTHDAWVYIYSFLAFHYMDIVLVIIILYLSLYLFLVMKKKIIRRHGC
ncbi:MAG: metallophosphoesterase [Thermodesulfovibrionales bacterium]|nr:metallophosphoesterase [Thermodesulfovibrionales bacterium]